MNLLKKSVSLILLKEMILTDPTILAYILKKIIGSSDPLEDHLAHHFINFIDDQFTIIQGSFEIIQDGKRP